MIYVDHPQEIPGDALVWLAANGALYYAEQTRMRATWYAAPDTSNASPIAQH